MMLLTTRCVSQSSPRTRILVLSSALIGLLACVVDSASAQSSEAQSSATRFDADGDGLSRMQEMVFGTSPTNADTDGDGVSDLEEFARGSSPLSAMSTPNLTKPLGLAMTASAQSDGLHALICVYMADTNLREKSLKFGFYSDDRVLSLTDTFLALNSSLDFKPSVTPSGAVAVIDVPFSADLVHAVGHLTLWAHASLPGVPNTGLGSTIQLVSIGGIVAFAMPAPAPVIALSSPSSGSQDRGTIYVPLIPPTPGSGAVTAPPGWASGEVCLQRSSPVGVNGATVTNEVISADCANGWDGFCPPSCGSSVGSTYKTVDPLVLLGG